MRQCDANSYCIRYCHTFHGCHSLFRHFMCRTNGNAYRYRGEQLCLASRRANNISYWHQPFNFYNLHGNWFQRWLQSQQNHHDHSECRAYSNSIAYQYNDLQWYICDRECWRSFQLYMVAFRIRIVKRFKPFSHNSVQYYRFQRFLCRGCTYGNY